MSNRGPYAGLTKGRRGTFLLFLSVALLGAMARLWLFSGPSPEDTVRTIMVPTPPPPVTVADTLRRGQTLGVMLEAYGLSGAQVARLVDVIRNYENPRRLQPGMVVHFSRRPAEPPDRIRLELDKDRRLYLSLDSGDGEWSARLDSVEVLTDTIRVGGLVRTNLYDAELWGDVDRLAPGEAHELVYRLAQIYAWQIDFYRDIRVGDWYRAAVEREVRPDGSVRSARILASDFQNAGRTLTAIRFQPDPEGRVEYYDREGKALRGQFLRAPLDFGRVTSSFSYRRYHPVLKRRRPHLGTDYGAPVGTPVRATGGGWVTRAGRWGSYGRMVEIRHSNGLRTRYAHMSGLAKKIRVGVRVEQGQAIGYVGTSGLSTAPHLHYEFLQGGRQVNPARLNLPRAEPVPAEQRERFDRNKEAALAIVAELARPHSHLAETSIRSLSGAGKTDD